MKLRIFAGCLLLIVSACTVKEDLCAAYLCEPPTVTLRLKFKDSNDRDLLFSSNPLYSVNDLKVFSSLFPEKILFRIDSTDKSNKYIVIPVSKSQSLTLKLADKPQDIINIDTQNKDEGCCKSLEVQSLTLNQATICNDCNTLQQIILTK